MKLGFKLIRGLKAKTILPVVLILVVAMSGLALFNYSSQVSVLNSEAEESIRSTLNTAHIIIDGHLNLYQQMAALLANNPTVAETLSKGDRGKLIAELSPAFEALRKRVQLNQFNFHKPPGVVLLRLQDMDRYGDNLATVRRTIADVYEKKTGVKGIEFGRTGLGLRGVEPVFSKGVLVGSLEFGGDLFPALNEAKKAFGVECGVVVSKAATAIAQTMPEWQKSAKAIGEYLSFYSTSPELTQGILSPALIAKAKKGGTGHYIEKAGYAGKDYYVGISPLKDYSGAEIGYIYVFKDRTALIGKIDRTLIINASLFLGVLFIIVLAINVTLKRTVIEPVIGLSKAATDVSKGKLADKVEMKTNDEIETLAKSIDRLRVSMKMLLE